MLRSITKTKQICVFLPNYVYVFNLGCISLSSGKLTRSSLEVNWMSLGPFPTRAHFLFPHPGENLVRDRRVANPPHPLECLDAIGGGLLLSLQWFFQIMYVCVSLCGVFDCCDHTCVEFTTIPMSLSVGASISLIIPQTHYYLTQHKENKYARTCNFSLSIENSSYI